jgi:hypothetical protein
MCTWVFNCPLVVKEYRLRGRFRCIVYRVVTRTFSDGRMSVVQTIERWPRGRPLLGRIVASFLKLPGVKQCSSARPRPCVHADGPIRPRGRDHASARTRLRVPADAPMRPRGRDHASARMRLGVHADTSASARMQGRIRADAP